jgi:hypothetical protein
MPGGSKLIWTALFPKQIRPSHSRRPYWKFFGNTGWMTAIAAEAGFPREMLYRALRGTQTSFRIVVSALSAIGYQFVVRKRRRGR